MFGKFQAEFRWSKQNVPRITICEDGEEYSLIHVESADGDYVRRIRDACIVWLTEIREAQSGHPRIYVYGSKDVKDAMRFTEDEARELAERRHAEAVKIE